MPRDGGVRVLPMFPLGTVLLPSMLLPLHVFEDRYRRMVAVVLADDPPEFGVVLIERGSEVGGGDVRVDVGCIARVVRAGRSDDGRWALECVGDRRIEVLRWMADDPYPRAEVRDLPDTGLDSSDLDRAELDRAFGSVELELRRAVALGSELGGPALVDPLELDGDPVRRSYQLGVLAPIGALDRQRVLSAAGPVERLAVLGELLAEQCEILRGRLALGGS